MPNLRSIELKRHPEPGAGHPYTVASIRTLVRLEFLSPVTIFVGDNGSGKSTLLEGIAAATELPAIGSMDIQRDETLAAARDLALNLRLAWTRRSRQGFFLRTEDAFGYARRMAREDARCLRERAEAMAGTSTNQEPGRWQDAQHPDERASARHISRYDALSHGESLMQLLSSRIRRIGLHLLDEPEVPLSPRQQIELLSLLCNAAKSGAQFVIATHSPILLACPGATLYSFDRIPVARTRYDELDHVRVMRAFLADPDAYLRRLGCS
jgi:predicted ATPase